MFSFSFPSKKPKPRPSSAMNPRRPRPKLERRNAAKNIDYDASPSSFASPGDDDSPDTLRFTRSLDLSPSSYSNQTSFRIGGSIEGEVDLIYQSLGLSGPEDFAIPAADWEATRAQRSSSDLLSRSRLYPTNRDLDDDDDDGVRRARVVEKNGGIKRAEPRFEEPVVSRISEIERVRKNGGGDGGIRGVRPPTLTPPETKIITTQSAPPTVSRAETNPSPSSVLPPPPSISLPELEKVGCPWDLVKSFAPDDGEKGKMISFEFESEEEEEQQQVVGGGLRRDTGWEDVASTSNDAFTSNDDDSSSTTTEVMFVISPNGRFKRIIKGWEKGHLLGSGSFGTVYEGISV